MVGKRLVPKRRRGKNGLSQGESTAAAETAPAATEAATATVERPDGSRGRSATLPDLLVNSEMVSQEEVTKAQENALSERLPFWWIVIRDGLIPSDSLATLVSLHFGFPLVDLRNYEIDREAIKRIPEGVARKYTVLAVGVEGNTLTVAMVDPGDIQLTQDLAALTEFTINPVVCRPEDIREHLDISYRLIETEDQLKEDGSGGGGQSTEVRVSAASLRQAQPAQIIELLIRQAVQDRASDIHMTPAEMQLRVRFRIDGILHDVATLPIESHPGIISRLKIIAGLNIAERRRPQDGQFTADVQGRKVDVRLAISSTVSGEMAVMRLLDKSGFTLFGLNELGMEAHFLEQYRNLLKMPYGMIIVCGPTGSGKSTTLYASLLQMDRVERNLITLEDPVEYRINATSQMQVHAEAGVTFATQLRSILRLDPDVILLGEVRDQETATIAAQAALTGHLVLTTLHANDGVSALVRLRDLGLPAYLVASSVAGIASQRMVRAVCKDCQVRMKRPIAEQDAYRAETGEDEDTFVYGEGCNICAHTGYRGRTGVYEVLTFTDQLRQLFLDGAPRQALMEQARKDGLVPMRTSGMQKVKEGVTTPYEVMRVLFTLE